MSEDYREFTAHGHPSGFRSPFVHLLGIELEVEEEGYALLRMPVEERHLNWRGAVHGGVICSLVDMAASRALGTIIRSSSRQPVGTLDLNVTFVRPGRGPFLTAEGRVLHIGRSVAVGEVSVYRDGHQTVARGRVTYILGKEDA
ncbi:MAG TPA: PaaI family thioesterase [Dehalococcoidia bacterium]|nr:PaaI family thioesterase [Dehalococcoidia bacterium]